jgi:hypothetical protein
MIHRAAGIVRGSMRGAWVGQGRTPAMPGKGRLWGFAIDVASSG